MQNSPTLMTSGIDDGCDCPHYFAEPRTQILSEPALHVEQDSALKLTCIITADDTSSTSNAVPNNNKNHIIQPLTAAGLGGNLNQRPKIFWYKDSQVRIIFWQPGCRWYIEGWEEVHSLFPLPVSNLHSCAKSTRVTCSFSCSTNKRPVKNFLRLECTARV